MIELKRCQTIRNVSMLLDQTQLSPSLAKSEWKKPPFEVCLKLCIKTVPAGAFSASIDLPSRHWERTAVDMQIISLVPPSPPVSPLYTSLPPIFTPSLFCKRMPNVISASYRVFFLTGPPLEKLEYGKLRLGEVRCI